MMKLENLRKSKGCFGINFFNSPQEWEPFNYLSSANNREDEMTIQLYLSILYNNYAKNSVLLYVFTFYRFKYGLVDTNINYILKKIHGDL